MFNQERRIILSGFVCGGGMCGVCGVCGECMGYVGRGACVWVYGEVWVWGGCVGVGVFKIRSLYHIIRTHQRETV